MRYWKITSWDRPGALALRQQTRAQHLEHIKGQAGPARTLFGAPMLDAEGAMIGTFIIVVAHTREQAEAFAEADPYRKVDLFERTEIIELHQSFDWTPLIPGIQPHKPAP